MKAEYKKTVMGFGKSLGLGMDTFKDGTLTELKSDDDVDKDNKIETIRNLLSQIANVSKAELDPIFNHSVQPASLGEDDKFKKLGLAAIYPGVLQDERKRAALNEDLSKLRTRTLTQRAFDSARTVTMFSSTRKAWSVFQKHGVITGDVIKFVKSYFAEEEQEYYDEDDQPYLYANLILGQNKVGKTQKFHADHDGEPFEELILAIDTGNSPLKTRYVMGSHKINRINFPERLRDRSLSGRQRCDVARWRHAITFNDSTSSYKNPLFYTEADAPMIIFDAGALHSGNAVKTTGRRVFFTIRKKSFHQAGAGQSTHVDVWGNTTEINLD